MDVLSTDAGQTLLSELDCPVCFDFMVPPIMLCENGHNICQRCRPKLKMCPTCKGSILKVRNVALEKVARQMPQPCKYRSFGCKEVSETSQIKEHEESCNYMAYKCPIRVGIINRCPWKGVLAELKNHLKNSHDNKYFSKKDIASGEFLDIQKNVYYDGVIHTKGKLFYFHVGCSEKDVISFIQYVGPKKNSSKYTYKMMFKKPSDKVCVTHKSLSCIQQEEDVYKSGKYIKIKYRVVEDLLDEEKKLKVDINISKEK